MVLTMTLAVAAQVLSAAEAAGEGTAALPGLPPLAQYGVAGVVAAAFVTRKIVVGWQFDRLEKEYLELKQENRDLVKLNFETQQQVLPALETSTRALAEVSFLVELARRGQQLPQVPPTPPTEG